MVDIVKCVLEVGCFGGFDVVLLDIVGCFVIDEVLMVEVVEI